MDMTDLDAQQQPHLPPRPGEMPPPQPPHAPPPRTPDSNPPPVELPGEQNDEPDTSDHPPPKELLSAVRLNRLPWPRRSDRLYGYGGRRRRSW